MFSDAVYHDFVTVVFGQIVCDLLACGGRLCFDFIWTASLYVWVSMPLSGDDVYGMVVGYVDDFPFYDRFTRVPPFCACRSYISLRVLSWPAATSLGHVSS